MNAPRTQLLIDTDPGVDDALAILMAHAHADVVALTVAAGNVGLEHTVANALKLVELVGATTPVHAGCATPLVLPAADASFVHGRDGFGDIGYAPAAARASSEHAANAMVRLARERPGQLTLVALGPLTNLALALRLEPQLPTLIRRLVVMGGAVSGRGNFERVPTEFNIGFDPEAAHVVFAQWPQFELVDWEACVRHALPFERYDALLAAGGGMARFYGRIAATARAFNAANGRGGMVVADALAMAVALAPDLVRSAQARHVGVELAGSLTRGATVVDWDARCGRAANARIVLEVDQAGFEAMVARGLALPATV